MPSEVILGECTECGQSVIAIKTVDSFIVLCGCSSILLRLQDVDQPIPLLIPTQPEWPHRSFLPQSVFRHLAPAII